MTFHLLYLPHISWIVFTMFPPTNISLIYILCTLVAYVKLFRQNEKNGHRIFLGQGKENINALFETIVH
ncbi:hypothetical protein BLX87_15375 [Bacillus sp. VT-16-64]|nr:hypothetical protein BLX87_15375 [Bacillus sp. VT-16-64]